MPKYFFDVYDNDKSSLDSTGIELADDIVARDEATRTLTEIAAQEIPGDGPERSFQIIVRDANHDALFEIRIEFNSQVAEANVSEDVRSPGGDDDATRD